DEPSDGLDPEGIHDMRKTILRLHSELGLTILLSSHFLNEVEQLCTRIAVLSRGRMVFEGDLAKACPRDQWIRLKAGDFDQAIKVLGGANLIRDSRDGNLIALCAGVGTDQVVQLLVQRGVPVFEIAPQEQTLEDFYLALMNDERDENTRTSLAS